MRLREAVYADFVEDMKIALMVSCDSREEEKGGEEEGGGGGGGGGCSAFEKF